MKRLPRVPLACLAFVLMSAAAFCCEDDGAAFIQSKGAFELLPADATRLGGPVHDLGGRAAAYWFDEGILREMVDVFRRRPNGFADGEFWGKTTRALARQAAATGEPRLRALLEQTLADLISTQDANGCISGYKPDKQPFNTDVWDRKYVLLGLLHGYTVTRDPKVLEAAEKAAHHLLSQIGPPPRVRVCDTHYITGPPRQTGGFQGMESTSVLEPIAWLYQLTGKREYIDFCRYLIEVEGGSKRGSIFQAALENKDVREFGGDGTPRGTVAHAYNIISCFEGLSEYHRATGEDRWKSAVLNVHDNILAKENTIIGASCGLGPNQGLASTEQFSHTAFHQTMPVQEGLEGCTHARWMGLNRRLLLLTGDPRHADEFEHTLYNALLGAIRPDGKLIDYHTWMNGTRPAKMNYRKTFKGRVITCCVFNVLDSLALAPSVAVMRDARGPVVNLYLPGISSLDLGETGKVRFITETDYPASGLVRIKVEADGKAEFPIRFRVPAWSENTRITIGGESSNAKPGTYHRIERKWKTGDVVELEFDMATRLLALPDGTPEAGRGFRALVRGPIVLARDLRLGGDIHEGVAIAANGKGLVDARPLPPLPETWMRFSIPMTNGGRFEVMDFASSGNTWDARSERMTWIPLPGSTPPNWIWFAGDAWQGGNAPLGKRWFRKVLAAPEGRSIRKIEAVVAADNRFELFTNGVKTGGGDSWQKPARFLLSPGSNETRVVLAIEAENTPYAGPNAAGLIASVTMTLDDGSTLKAATGSSWKATNQAADGWMNPDFDDSSWPAARALGPNGMPPWRKVPLETGEPFQGGLGF